VRTGYQLDTFIYQGLKQRVHMGPQAARVEASARGLQGDGTLLASCLRWACKLSAAMERLSIPAWASSYLAVYTTRSALGTAPNVSYNPTIHG